jgi:hypothetical protein
VILVHTNGHKESTGMILCLQAGIVRSCADSRMGFEKPAIVFRNHPLVLILLISRQMMKASYSFSFALALLFSK